MSGNTKKFTTLTGNDKYAGLRVAFTETVGDEFIIFFADFAFNDSADGQNPLLVPTLWYPNVPVCLDGVITLLVTGKVKYATQERFTRENMASVRTKTASAFVTKFRHAVTAAAGEITAVSNDLVFSFGSIDSSVQTEYYNNLMEMLARTAAQHKENVDSSVEIEIFRKGQGGGARHTMAKFVPAPVMSFTSAEPISDVIISKINTLTEVSSVIPVSATEIRVVLNVITHEEFVKFGEFVLTHQSDRKGPGPRAPAWLNAQGEGGGAKPKRKPDPTPAEGAPLTEASMMRSLMAIARGPGSNDVVSTKAAKVSNGIKQLRVALGALAAQAKESGRESDNIAVFEGLLDQLCASLSKIQEDFMKASADKNVITVPFDKVVSVTGEAVKFVLSEDTLCQKDLASVITGRSTLSVIARGKPLAGLAATYRQYKSTWLDPESMSPHDTASIQRADVGIQRRGDDTVWVALSDIVSGTMFTVVCVAKKVNSKLYIVADDYLLEAYTKFLTPVKEDGLAGYCEIKVTGPGGDDEPYAQVLSEVTNHRECYAYMPAAKSKKNESTFFAKQTSFSETTFERIIKLKRGNLNARSDSAPKIQVRTSDGKVNAADIGTIGSQVVTIGDKATLIKSMCKSASPKLSVTLKLVQGWNAAVTQGFTLDFGLPIPSCEGLALATEGEFGKSVSAGLSEFFLVCPEDDGGEVIKEGSIVVSDDVSKYTDSILITK